MTLDPIKRTWWQLKLKLAFHERRGEAFQDLFADIMARRYRNDFLRSRPWGDEGDRKNDGYLRSTKTLFQVYGPDEVTAASTIAKINEDFAGALEHWDKHLSQWVFVHNGRGLGPQVTAKLLDAIGTLRAKPHGRQLGIWSYEDLEPLVIGLPEQNVAPMAEQDIEVILGPAVSLDDLRRVAYAEIQPLLVMLANTVSRPDAPMRREVPLEKMDYNELPESVRLMLRIGSHRAHEVTELLHRSPTPQLGDLVATAYRARYSELRANHLRPDEIFTELWSFTTSTVKGNVAREAAAWTVLAYFFSTCDIFEDTPGAFGAASDPVQIGDEGVIVVGRNEP